MQSAKWELIANYESFELVKRDYLARHGRTPATGHAREIAAPFSHARSYFRSARDADLTVKPLLLYYGVVSLSRGLTLLLSRGFREAALTPSHGLAAKDWARSLSSHKPRFPNLRIEITGGGSFVDLGTATGHRSLLRANSSGVNFTTAATVPTIGSAFTLGDLLAREPALQEHYVRWDSNSLCAPIATEQKVTESGAVIKLLKRGKPHMEKEVGDRIFAGTPFQFIGEDVTALSYTGPNSVNALPGLTDGVSRGALGIGDLWVTARLPGGAKLSKIEALFALSYALGMLVRYFPTQWNALVKGQVEDGTLPTLAAAIAFIEAMFPAVVVDFLTEKFEE